MTRSTSWSRCSRRSDWARSDLKRIEDLGVTHIRVKPPEEDDYAIAREIYHDAVNVVVSVLKEIRLGKIRSETDRGLGRHPHPCEAAGGGRLRDRAGDLP